MTHSTLRSPVTWLLALIVIQPVLDVLSYWLNASGSENTLTLALRLLLLLKKLLHWGNDLSAKR